MQGTSPIADCNSHLSVDDYGHDLFSSESEFPENLFITECSIQWIGSVPKDLAPSQHLYQPRMYKTEQPFLSGI